MSAVTTLQTSTFTSDSQRSDAYTRFHLVVVGGVTGLSCIFIVCVIITIIIGCKRNRRGGKCWCPSEDVVEGCRERITYQTLSYDLPSVAGILFSPERALPPVPDSPPPVYLELTESCPLDQADAQTKNQTTVQALPSDGYLHPILFSPERAFPSDGYLHPTLPPSMQAEMTSVASCSSPLLSRHRKVQVEVTVAMRPIYPDLES